MAFWEIAKIKGYINNEIYEKGKLSTKRGRLIAIGATAKTESKWFYDGNKYIFCKPKKILDTNKVFYSCAYETSRIINEIRIATGNDYLFYWIDAIFIHANHNSIRKCIEVAEKFGLSGKFKYLDLIYSDSHSINVYDNNGKERIFMKAKNKEL